MIRIFRSSPLLASALIVLLATASACSEGSEPATQTSGEAAASDAAVEEAIQAHLAKRTDLNLGAMDIAVETVTYPAEDQARAEVVFRAKGSPKAMLEMTYRLEREAGAWRVLPGAAQGATTGAPPQQTTPGGGMPPDHPAIGDEPTGGSSSELPPGHPPVEQ